MTHTNDAKYAALLAQTGQTDGHIDDLELLYLEQQTGATGHVNDLWLALFKANGATSDNWNDAAYEFLLNLGAPQGHIDDMWFYFWDNLQGGIGPTAIITQIVAGACEYEPPVTTECLATGQYRVTGNNFTGPINSWVWSIDAGDAAITAGQGTDTVTVRTGAATESDVDEPFTLSCTIGDGTDTASRTVVFTHTHRDGNELPVFIGPNIPDFEFTRNEAITPFDVSPRFTGTNLTYAVVGTLPAGLSFDTGTGVLSGTPTAVETQDITFTATNSKGTATSNTVNINVSTDVPIAPSLLTATAVAFNQIDLSWTDNSNNETGFRVERSLDGTTGWASVGTVGVDVTTFSDTTVSELTQYFYRVFAFNGSGDSAPSNVANATTPAEPVAGPAFWAATYDPVTFACEAQRVGAGSPTHQMDDGTLLLRNDGFFEPGSLNSAPWWGARWSGGQPFADDGGGVLLPEPPGLLTSPAITNQLPYSYDMTQTAWPKTSVSVALDQTGLTGAVNEASTITVASAGNNRRVTEIGQVVVAGASTIECIIDGANSTSPFLMLGNTNYDGGAVPGANSVWFSTADGSVGTIGANIDAAESEVLAPGVYRCYVQFSTTTELTGDVRITLTDTDGGVASDLGETLVVRHACLHSGKTLAEVFASPPVRTNGATVSQGQIITDFSHDNQDTSKGAWYAEVYKANHLSDVQAVLVADGAGSASGNIMGTLSSLRGWTRYTGGQLNTGTPSVIPVGEYFPIGIPYDIASSEIGIRSNRAGSDGWVEQTNFGGYVAGVQISSGRSVSASIATQATVIRDVRRYDVTDYAEAKAILDGLMP